MAPALLGVGVSQISLLINTQIASRLMTGSVTWLNYADRLMEFPTAMLGVALGVVLMPRLSSARAEGQTGSYSKMLDWGLRLVVLLSLPCAVALFLFHLPLAATLYHYGAYAAADVLQTSHALQWYGVGLLGLVSVKVLASGYYAGKDIKTPVKIGVVVLIATQLFNLLFVPHMQVAGLALSIGCGALLNAAWLLIGLIRQGSYRPEPGWVWYMLRVLIASMVMGVFLVWSQTQYNWLAPQGGKWMRAVVLAGLVLGAAFLYFSSLIIVGFKPKRLLKP
jgi:putative peptidoglycan lipid II flippase